MNFMTLSWSAEDKVEEAISVLPGRRLTRTIKIGSVNGASERREGG